MSDESFKNYPLSLNEIKSEKEHDASLWTPRDCLIDLLRQIDNGKKINSLIICYEYTDENEYSRASHQQSTKNGLTTLGLLNLISTKLGLS